MDFEQARTQLRARASGCMEPFAAAQFATSAIIRAHVVQARTLLLDFSRARLVRPFNTFEAYDLGGALARIGTGVRRIAFIMCSACIDEHQFVLTVAANRGLRAAFFSDEAQALRWLQDAEA